MKRVSLASPEFTYDPEDPPGFRAGMFRFGPLLGAEKMGATLYELRPGEALCPFHWEAGEEEWLLVLDGAVSVRHADGTDVLQPLEATCFALGPAGVHQVLNASDATVRVLMWSTIVTPTATFYPDSDKVGIWTGDKTHDVLVKRSSAVGYYEGEAREPGESAAGEPGAW